MSQFKEIKWLLLLVAGLGTLVFLLLADVVFVTYYGQLVNPGQEQAFYDQFALDTAGPFMFCFAPFPLYIITRWLCARINANAYLVAFLYFGAIHLIDTTMIIGMGGLASMLTLPYVLNVASQLAGIMLGARMASTSPSNSFQPGRNENKP